MENRFETFSSLISKISRCIKKIKIEEVIEYNLKGLHVSCLYYLYKQNGELTPSELSEICDEDKAAISRSLDYLESEEYITCNETKKYKCPIYLTGKGLAVGEKIAKKVDQVVDLASLGLTENDRKILYKSLFVVSNNLAWICASYEGEKK